MNRQLSEPNQMQVFPKNSPFLPTGKIGKNNPKAEFIEETNRLKDEWNGRYDCAIIRKGYHTR